MKSRIKILQREPIPEKNMTEESNVVQEKLLDKSHVLGFRFSIYPNLKRKKTLNVHIIRQKENNTNLLEVRFIILLNLESGIVEGLT